VENPVTPPPVVVEPPAVQQPTIEPSAVLPVAGPPVAEQHVTYPSTGTPTVETPAAPTPVTTDPTVDAPVVGAPIAAEPPAVGPQPVPLPVVDRVQATDGALAVPRVAVEPGPFGRVGPLCDGAGASRSLLAESFVPLPGAAGHLAVALSGLAPVEHGEFRSRASVSEAGSSPRSDGPGGQNNLAPFAPGSSAPIPGLDAGGTTTGGAGSSGSAAGPGSLPLAVLGETDAPPTAFALAVLGAPERCATWWYPEVVVGPG
jgi:hypothetical protein